mgnify:FL=1
MITYRTSFYRELNFKVSTILLLDALLLGSITSYSILLIPIFILITMNHLNLFLILITISIVIAIMQDIATLLVSRRFGHYYCMKDQISLCLFLPIEVILYRIMGVLFVTVGTILYFVNKDRWDRSERIGLPIMLDTKLKQPVKDTLGG